MKESMLVANDKIYRFSIIAATTRASPISAVLADSTLHRCTADTC
jgi:hypothetical protein